MVSHGFPARSAAAFMAAVAIALIALLASGGHGWAQSANTNNGAAAGAQDKGDKAKSGERSNRSGGRGRGRRGRRGGPALVEVDAVQRGPVVETVPVYGRIVAPQSGVVAALTKGAVNKVFVKVGDRVAAGDVLVTLQADMNKSERALKAAELAEYRAKVGTARVQLKLAEQELARIERLRQSAAFSGARYNDKQRDVERVRSMLSEALAKVEQARAELAIADLNLGYTNIKAPFAGVVSERHVNKGAYLSVGQKVVTMINDHALEIEADVPSVHISGLKKGTRVSVNPELGKSFSADVRAVLPVENPLARTRTVRFIPVADGGAHALATNQSVVVGVPSGPMRIALSVHKDAVVHRDGRPIVFVFDKGHAALREVTLGGAFSSRFEVVAGLNAGDLVVIRGNERLRDGQPLRTSGDRE